MRKITTEKGLAAVDTVALVPEVWTPTYKAEVFAEIESLKKSVHIEERIKCPNNHTYQKATCMGDAFKEMKCVVCGEENLAKNPFIYACDFFGCDKSDTCVKCFRKQHPNWRLLENEWRFHFYNEKY